MDPPPTYPVHAPPGTPTLVESRPPSDPTPHVSGGESVSVEEALSVMANHVEEMGNGGEMMHVPPDEDISEHLPSVTGAQSSPQEHSNNRNSLNREGKCVVFGGGGGACEGGQS